MANIKYFKRIEKEVNKRLHKVYRKDSYFVIDRVQFDLSDEGYYTVYSRTGYTYKDDAEEEKVRQVELKSGLTINDYFKNAGEFASYLVIQVIEVLDHFIHTEAK